MNQKKTAVDVYISAVFKWGLIILVSACMCATVMFNTEKLFGFYPEVSWITLILFALMDISFFICAILIVKTSFDEDGYLKPERLKLGKWFSAIVLIIQWNYLLYMLPSRTFWGFLFFFLVLMAFYLDVKMVLFSGLACMISLFIGWAIKGTDLMPVKDELQKYFEDLHESFSFQQKMHFSGNEIIDAVLNHDLPRHCEERVNITVYGTLPKLETVSAMDLCTLFSNLLSNAITSANQCEEIILPQIVIHFSGGKSYFCIEISNSIKEQRVTVKHRRKDRNHGHGIHKMRDVIEKYGGRYEVKLEEQMITIKIYLPV